MPCLRALGAVDALGVTTKRIPPEKLLLPIYQITPFDRFSSFKRQGGMWGHGKYEGIWEESWMSGLAFKKGPN